MEYHVAGLVRWHGQRHWLSRAVVGRERKLRVRRIRSVERGRAARSRLSGRSRRVGLNVIQGAAFAGAARIIAVDLAASKLTKQFGATDTVNAKDVSDVPSAIKELADGLGVGVPPMGAEVPIPDMMLVLEEKSVFGCLYGSGNIKRDMPMLLDLYMHKKLKIDELASKRIKLDDVNAAFDVMEKGEVARSVIVY